MKEWKEQFDNSKNKIRKQKQKQIRNSENCNTFSKLHCSHQEFSGVKKRGLYEIDKNTNRSQEKTQLPQKPIL